MCKAAGAVFGTEAVLEASRSEYTPTSSPPGPGHAWVGRRENGHGHSFPAVGKKPHGESLSCLQKMTLLQRSPRLFSLILAKKQGPWLHSWGPESHFCTREAPVAH